MRLGDIDNFAKNMKTLIKQIIARQENRYIKDDEIQMTELSSTSVSITSKCLKVEEVRLILIGSNSLSIDTCNEYGAEGNCFNKELAKEILNWCEDGKGFDIISKYLERNPYDYGGEDVEKTEVIQKGKSIKIELGLDVVIEKLSLEVKKLKKQVGELEREVEVVNAKFDIKKKN